MRTALTSSLLVVLLGLAGCTFSRSRTNITDFHNRVEGVIVGQTSIDEVPGILGGAPSNIIPAPGGRSVFVYTFADSKTGGLNLLVFNTRRTNVGLDTAIIVFGVDGVVEQVSVSDNSKDLTWDWWAFGDA